MRQRAIYEEQGNEIDRIQKEILALAQKEEAYDIFICYKETDADGKRTPDSVIANDIYYQLTQEGFKVFYAAITLEGKLGSAYEPIIFAALNSAKVMLSIGTKPEYFNAVWVKNEWSRYLKIIKQDRTKLLIPCYRDMDAYELPEEFAHLQAQDMAKIGYINDLVRGIKKVIQKDEPKQSPVTETIVSASNVNTSPLLKRAFMFLEDGEWEKADDFCEQVLNQDPENAMAYLGKLMAELKVKHQDDLKDLAEPFDSKNNYQKAIRFADDSLKSELVGYIQHIKVRNENARLEDIYRKAVKLMVNARSEDEYKDASRVFASILTYKNAKDYVSQCAEKAETARKEAIFSSAKSKMNSDNIYSCENAIKLFESLGDYRGASELIVECQQKIEKLKNEIAEKEQQKAIMRKKAIKIATIATPIVCAIIAFVIVLNTVIIPNVKYNNAIELMNAGKYSEAISAFEAMEGYKDSVTKINECNTAILDGKYNDAIVLMNAGNLVEAYEALVGLEGYKDSADKANSIYDKYKVEKLKVAKVGDYVFFGSYEQENNTSNGKEDIEWLVLEVKDRKALVISKYALDCKPYNTSFTDVTWETCTLRKWLNNDFINAAFSADEKAMIPTVTVSADKNPKYSTNPGNATQDRVFLLSITEANKYFSSDSARQCKPTEYAVAGGAYVNSWWWLRSPGFDQYDAAFVYGDGDVHESGLGVDRVDFAVRPALWIDLS